MSDCYVNLNTHEIFGMAILEAMYYEGVVVALRAPGPELIIENEISGYLCNSDEELLDRIEYADKTKTGKQAKERVLREFVWQESVKKMGKLIAQIMLTC